MNRTSTIFYDPWYLSGYLQVPPIRPDDRLRHRSRPADGIRAGLQHRELTVHMVIHQGISEMSFTVIHYFIPGVVSKKNALIFSGEYWLCLAHQRMVSAKAHTI